MPDRLHHQTRPGIIEYARDRNAKRNQSELRRLERNLILRVRKLPPEKFKLAIPDPSV
jgi:hypothetical protein